jgi:peptidyl-prolyl cis-trans isomerase C
MKKLALVTMAACLQLAAVSAGADDQTVVAKNSKGLSVTVADLEAEAVRYSPDTVKSSFSRPEGIRQIAHNLLLRRALTKEAEAEQLDKTPAMATRLRLAREKVLSDAQVQQFDGVAPDIKTLEKLALAEYNAYPEKYVTAETVSLLHILIGRYRKDGRQLADDLLSQIKSKGADFGGLAIMYSDEAGTKANRGDMGSFEKGKLRPELESAAFGLAKVGDVSEVIATELGWHILKLTARQPAGRKPFEEVKADLIRAAARNVVDKRRAAHLDPLERDVVIDEKVVEAMAARYR